MHPLTSANPAPLRLATLVAALLAGTGLASAVQAQALEGRIV